MRTVIVGCGRVGAMLAVMLDDGGHNVTVLDIATGAFDRLPSTFKGNALRGDGTDEDTLRRAGTEDADLFLAMTEGDNRNIMAAQLASEAFRVGQVIAKINDPLRALAYAELGIATICRTDLMANAILSYLKLPVSVVPGVRSSTGHHRHEPEDGPAGHAAGGGDVAADLIAGLAEAGIPIRTLDASTPPSDGPAPATEPGSEASSGPVKVEG
ncbi:MAG TPA: TrkA family potassium uptake protein [Candidatus Limnocylindrales bacterium]|jgi:trk system potassium uptake protein TrkA